MTKLFAILEGDFYILLFLYPFIFIKLLSAYAVYTWA